MKFKPYIVHLALIFTCAMPAHAERVYYFADKKTKLVGLKSQSGKILVPARYSNIWGPYQEPIGKRQREIEFIGTHWQNDRTDALSIAGGDVYNRKGKYLYSPLWFDMGLDYWAEGRRRFVENGKVGFVNRSGKKVIPAQYQSVSAFWNGYAVVHTGNWKKRYAENGDYRGIEPADETGKTYIIDYKGNAIDGFSQRQSPDDVEIEGRFYPCYLKKCDPDKSFF